jgi:hypothetical protein
MQRASVSISPVCFIFVLDPLRRFEPTGGIEGQVEEEVMFHSGNQGERVVDGRVLGSTLQMDDPSQEESIYRAARRGLWGKRRRLGSFLLD